MIDQNGRIGVGRIPTRRSCIVVTISVVARPTIGMPTIIASTHGEAEARIANGIEEESVVTHEGWKRVMRNFEEPAGLVRGHAYEIDRHISAGSIQDVSHRDVGLGGPGG